MISSSKQAAWYDGQTAGCELSVTSEKSMTRVILLFPYPCVVCFAVFSTFGTLISDQTIQSSLNFRLSIPCMLGYTVYNGSPVLAVQDTGRVGVAAPARPAAQSDRSQQFHPFHRPRDGTQDYEKGFSLRSDTRG